MKCGSATGIPFGVEVAQHRKGVSSLLKLQMLVGSVFGFLLVVMIGVASADDIPTSNPALPEVELAPAVVVAAGADSVNTNALTRLTAGSTLGSQSGTAFQLDDGRVVTVTHAVLDADEIGISSGSDFVAVEPDSVISSTLHDLSVLPGPLLAESFAVAKEPLALGQGVALGGIPSNGRIEVVTGEIIGRSAGVEYGIGRPDVYVISAMVEPGWSGGPVVNASGEVVAVIVGSEQVTGVTLAVPIEYLPG